MTFILVACLLGVAAVQASLALVSRQSITSLTTSQIDTFTPYTHFASAAYCDPSMTLSWSCGANCDYNAGFKPVASGGDGDRVQYWYVGYDSSLNEVIVAHQGSATIVALLTHDVEIVMGGLDSSLYPGISPDIQVHIGFRDEQAQTASEILQGVQTAMSKFGATSVTLVGHSLGAALSLLDSIYLPLRLPSGTTFQTIVHALPRVGNQAFADYVDANLHLTHINNLKDPIPILFPTSFGYVHPTGEVHIRETGEWAACPGQDNPSTECIVGDVPNVLMSNPLDHYGPYNGIEMFC
ncbi:Alpha/Beta hydrolase protein [Boletus edulis]|nr:Alpha/Beta hydrolase protein [Boletus edulis]